MLSKIFRFNTIPKTYNQLCQGYMDTLREGFSQIKKNVNCKYAIKKFQVGVGGGSKSDYGHKWMTHAMYYVFITVIRPR